MGGYVTDHLLNPQVFSPVLRPEQTRHAAYLTQPAVVLFSDSLHSETGWLRQFCLEEI
jgi:hypothetical protein